MTNNEVLKKEYNYLNKIYYFNILLIGRSGVGKSSFINAILGENKAFTNDVKLSSTFRCSHYIHKKYPINFIDCFGSAGDGEGKMVEKFFDSIYEGDNRNILIKNDNDFFCSFPDKRNYIHLILYFNAFRGENKLDIDGEDMDLMLIKELFQIENKNSKKIKLYY